MRRLLPLLLTLSALPGCGGEPWTSGQRDEAFRLCRAEIGFPPISVFRPDDYDFKIFMCRCEVGFLAERVDYQHFADNEHVTEVNRAIQVGRTVCLMRHKGGER